MIVLNVDTFLKAIFHAADKNLFSYLWQRNEIEKKAARTRSFKIEYLDVMAREVSIFNGFPYGVSFSMGLLDKPKNKHAADKDIVAIPCLWCDIDVFDFAHAEQNLFPSVESVLEMIESRLKPLELQPNIVVSSGHGVHLYWIFDRCILTQSLNQKQYARSLLTKIQSVVRHCSDGYSIDHTENLGRTLRVPDSFNWKGDPENPPRAAVLYHNDDYFDVEMLDKSINEALDSFLPVSNTPSEMSQQNLDAVERMRSNPTYEKPNFDIAGDSELLFKHCAFFKTVVTRINSLNYQTLSAAIPILLTDTENGENIAIDICRIKFGDKFEEFKTKYHIEQMKHNLKPTTCKRLRELVPSLDCSTCPVHTKARSSPCALIQSQDVKNIVESIPNSIGELFPDAPDCIRNLIFPRGYKITPDGVIALDGSKNLMAYPVFISRQMRNFDDNSLKYEIRFQKNDGVWIAKNLPMKNLVNSKYVTDTLADLGIPTNSNVAKPSVDFFSLFLAMNKDLLPEITCYSRVGWDGSTFRIPANLNDNEEIINGNFLHSLIPKGDIEKEKILLFEGLKYPAVRVLVAANLASPMLRLVNYRNFIVNIHGRTATGKTAALTLANSMLASQDYIIKLNTTANAFEIALSERNDMPASSNEWQLISSDPKFRDRFANGIIYKQESGTTKSRLNRNSESKPTQAWKSILIVTAEESIIRDNSLGGEKTRTLEFEFFPFIGAEVNGKSVIDEDFVARIYSQTNKNYGHIFPIFVNNLAVENKDGLVADWNDFIAEILNRAENKIQMDHAKMLGILMLAYQRFLRWIFNFSEEESRSITRAEFFPLISQIPEIEDSSDSQRAKLAITDWFYVHEMNFLSSDQNEHRITREIFGYIDEKDKIPMIVPAILKKALLEAGFSPTKIFAEWRREGVISYDEKSKQYSKAVRCIDDRVRRLTKLTFLKPEKADTPRDGFNKDENPF